MDIDLQSLRWTSADLSGLPSAPLKPSRVTTKPPAGRRIATGEKYLKGPIPLAWLTVASTCGLKGLHVAIAIWWLSGVSRASSVRLTRQSLAKFGVGPRTGLRCLQRMKTLGLVDFENHRGRGPMVTIINDVPHATD